MTYDTIKLELEPVDPDNEQGSLAVVTFNRPQVRNALNHQMVDELHAALIELRTVPDLRGVIFTGAGDKAFLGGADIGELRDRDRFDALARINSSLFLEVEKFPAPTVAAITGYALGGGCEMALACDLRICGDGAHLGQPEVGLGILPGAGATYRLPRIVGLSVAKELIFTGRMVDAHEALRIGLVNRVVSDEDTMHAAREMVRAIAQNSPLAVRFAKLAMNTVAGAQNDIGMALESTAQAVLFEDPDKMRRMTEFIERRAAHRAQRQRRDRESHGE